MLFTHTNLNSSARAMGGRACKRCLVLQERRARGEAEALEDLAACQTKQGKGA
jgi:methylphosphotriester-DNA--protein-cysteine methyltransferase